MMYNNEITKQMIDGHKTVFDAGFNSMVMLQEQTSQAVDHFLQQAPWIPGVTKSMINEWTGVCKKGTMDLRQAADLQYLKVTEALTSGLETLKPKAKSKN